MSQRKKLLQALVGAAVVAGTLFLRGDLTPESFLRLFFEQSGQTVQFQPSSQAEITDHSAIRRAFRDRRSGLMVDASATVSKVLPDDNKGSRHQRFILSLAGDLSVLVAHNIDLAKRVPLASGDRVEIRGQYEFNEKGGVLHWTHHDPAGRHPGGWIRHDGILYQ